MYSVLGARFGAGVGCSTLLVGGSREPFDSRGGGKSQF